MSEKGEEELNFNTLRKHLNNMQQRILDAHEGKGGVPPEKDYKTLWSALDELEILYGLKDKIAIEVLYGGDPL